MMTAKELRLDHFLIYDLQNKRAAGTSISRASSTRSACAWSWPCSTTSPIPCRKTASPSSTSTPISRGTAACSPRNLCGA